MSLYLLLPFAALAAAAHTYPEKSMDIFYTIGHSTLEAVAFVQIKLCPRKRKRKMSPPVMSNAASVLSTMLDPKEE
jgi:hypothetical protein